MNDYILKRLFAILLLLAIFVDISSQNNLKKTKILILGTHHLAQVENFEPKMLDEVVKKLDVFQFDAVCIENMPGELLYDIQSRNDSNFIDLLQYFGGQRLELAKLMQENLSVNFTGACKMIEELLRKQELQDNARILLVKYFVAATDLASATLHYQRIIDKSLIQKAAIPEKIVEALEKNNKAANEVYSLALRVADNQKLNKLEFIDNFQDEALLFKHFPIFLQDYKNNAILFKNIPQSRVFKKTNELLKHGIEHKNLLDLYMFLNSGEYMQQDFDAQWAIWLNTNFKSGSDRARYSLWEMRNLQIAANILKISAFYPGEKVLVVIGASHKSFIEKYLDQIPDIELLKFN